MIKNIEIIKIHHHPDNPRKDLGDLSELAESIKVHGVLQNLTLVPCFSNASVVGQEQMEYYAVIGNRRLAAAKLAGLTEVPATIRTDMDHKTQVATMLLENMQRSDLTIYEQAQGFQMMIDLGDSVTSISQKTGFSETTIRKRTKLLELDQEKFKNSVERGATLMDYVELEKIKDIELRNSVLEHIGTANFKWKLQNAIEKEKSEENKRIIISELEKFAIQIDDTYGFRYVKSYYSYNVSENSEIEVPDDADTVEYFFYVSQYNYISLHKKLENLNAENSNDSNNCNSYEEEAKKRREKNEELDMISLQAYMLRYDFVRNISNTAAKKNISAIAETLLWSIICDYVNFPDIEEYVDFFDIKLIDELNNEENDEEDIEELNFNTVREYIKTKPELYFLASAYLMLDSENDRYYDCNNNYRDNNTLNTVYALLEKLGYKKSDEEQALSDGTHTLFQS